VKTVGVLALQGDFEAHRKAIERAGARALEVRTAAELAQCDGLIIPGGESTTMLKLLEAGKLTDAVRDFAGKKPVYGSCAGAILLAREVTRPAQASLGLMDIDVERNGYGRQIDSRIAKIPVQVEESGEEKRGQTALSTRGPCVETEGLRLGTEWSVPFFEAVFIRAPIIRRVGGGARVLASYQGDPVWVEQGRHMVTTFHPELTEDSRIHRRFLEKL
jgi:5'-phosphate synthase pdxT subunit